MKDTTLIFQELVGYLCIQQKEEALGKGGQVCSNTTTKLHQKTKKQVLEFKIDHQGTYESLSRVIHHLGRDTKG